MGENVDVHTRRCVVDGNEDYDTTDRCKRSKVEYCILLTRIIAFHGEDNMHMHCHDLKKKKKRTHDASCGRSNFTFHYFILNAYLFNGKLILCARLSFFCLHSFSIPVQFQYNDFDEKKNTFLRCNML